MNANGAKPILSDEEAHRKANGLPEPVAPVPVVPSEKTRQKFVTSVHNSAGQTKRGLLDFLDFQEGILLRDPALEAIHAQIANVFAYSRRRIHNDISAMRDQVLACFQIYVNGGEIPAFGRSDEQRGKGGSKG